MTVDTSRPAVEALIAELRKDAKRDAAHRNEHARATRFNRKTMPSWVSADVLAALLDERDALQKMIDVVQKNLASRNVRIRDLEADLRKCGLRGEAKATEWREALERAERAEAERDRLSAELAQVKQCRDEYGDEIDVANARADRAEAKLDAVKRFSDEQRDRARLIRDERSGEWWAGVAVARQEVYNDLDAILADTETREEGDL